MKADQWVVSMVVPWAVSLADVSAVEWAAWLVVWMVDARVVSLGHPRVVRRESVGHSKCICTGYSYSSSCLQQ